MFKIADFGMARYSGSVGSVKTAIGTPIYMAPLLIDSYYKREKCRYTEKCDIWALGVLTFIIATGKFPWVF